MKKIIITAGSIVVFMTAGVSVWANSQEVSNPTVRESKPLSHINEHETYKETEPPEIYSAMMERWEIARDKITNQKLSKESDQSLQQWRIIPSSDIDLELTNTLSAEESSSFADALFSNERKNNIEPGDYFPAVLLNDAKDRAILTWLKGNGETVAIDIKSKLDREGKRTWYVDGNATKMK